MTTKTLLLPLVLLCGPMATSAQPDRIDDYFKAEMTKSRIPGLSVAVLQNGKVLTTKGYGLANVEFSVPVTGDTVHQLASATKIFTGTAIMMLVEEGKL